MSGFETSGASQVNMEITANARTRGQIANMLIKENVRHLKNENGKLFTTYNMLKSGETESLDEHKWGLFYAKNQTLILFLRKN